MCVCAFLECLFQIFSDNIFSLDFLSLRNGFTQLHDSFNARMEKNLQDDPVVPRMVNHDTDDNRNGGETENLTFRSNDDLSGHHKLFILEFVSLLITNSWIIICS